MNIVENKLQTISVDVVGLEFEVSPEDYSEAYNQSLEERKRNATLKGFRKGAAPLNLITKVYGEQALANSVGRAIVRAIENHVKDSGKVLYSNPNVVSYPTKWVYGETFKAAFTVRVIDAPKPKVEEKSAE